MNVLNGQWQTDSGRDALGHAALAGLSGQCVLVVDDNCEAAETLGRILEDRGAHGRIAGEHHSGLAALQDSRPVLLLSVIEPPDKDGYALIRKLRAFEAAPGPARLPATAMNAFNRPDDRTLTLEAGFRRVHRHTVRAAPAARRHPLPASVMRAPLRRTAPSSQR